MVDMNQNLVNVIGFLLEGKQTMLPLTEEYGKLKIVSDRGRVGTLDALTGLFQRKSQAAPIPRVLELYRTFYPSPFREESRLMRR